MAKREAKDDGEGPAERKPFLLRISPELMEELRMWAGQELRSLNGHIEWVLREAVKERKGGDGGKGVRGAKGKR
jgi:hypothetical protein